MSKRLIDKIEAPGGNIVVIGKHYGPIKVGGRPAPLFLGVPPELARPLIGRDAELAALRDEVCGCEAAALTALNGLPGVGKTALATALVYDPAVRKRFRGGVLWVGLGPTPDVESALGRWAAALDVELSAEQDASAKAQRLSVVLQRQMRGEPVLLVIDDAWKWEDAQPFREIAFPGCVRLLTTRDVSITRKFAARAIRVGELREEQAEALLAERCPEAKEADAGELRELARAVGGLPLGLTLIAATLNDHAGQGLWVRKEIARLTAAEARLELEAPERRPGLEGATNTLCAIVGMSVEALGAELQQGFEALGAFAPKPSNFGRDAVIAVWEIEGASGDAWLRRLVDRGLIEVVGEGRFTLHQVLAAVAEARLGDERGPKERHARFYLGLAKKDPEDWRSIERELGQIRQGWSWSSGIGREEALVLAYAYALGDFFERRGLWKERLAWIRRALNAAQVLRRTWDEGSLLLNLGRVHSDIGDKRRARKHYGQALLIHRAVGNRAGETATLLNLGNVYSAIGDQKSAREYYEQARLIYRAVGDRAGEAATLLNLGAVNSAVGDQKSARECYEEVLPIWRELGKRRDEAGTLNNLGIIHSSIGDKKSARKCYEQALSIQREVGDRAGEAATLNNLGTIYSDIGDRKGALEYYEQALPIYREMGNRLGEAATLLNVGEIYYASGHAKRAQEHYEQALPIYCDLGNWRAGEAKTLKKLGIVHYALGNMKNALGYNEQALPIWREVGDKANEAETLNNLGAAHSALGDMKNAREYYEQALPIWRKVGRRADEAGTLNNLGIVYVAMGDKQRAREYYEQALSIEREVGDKSGEVITLFNLAELRESEGDTSEAISLLEQVVTIEEVIQHPELELVRAYLGRLRAFRPA